jgi:hypothetical protein
MDSSDVSLLVVCGVVVIDKVINMLRSRGIDLHRITRQIDDLHRWHAVEDSEGVKIWYVRRSLVDAINKLATNIDQETKLLEKIETRMEKIEDKMGVLNLGRIPKSRD